MLNALSPADITALALFILVWILLEILLEHTALRRRSLSGLMAEQRRNWAQVLAGRELRMIDTQIISGLQQGSAFFTSTSIIAIGGCFALLGSTDAALQIYRDLPIPTEFDRVTWEIKVLCLAIILAYTFFKFGWAYRLFNYCGILIGAVPEYSETSHDRCHLAANKLADMNIIAGRHFNAGMRGLIFALGYLGWFVGPGIFMLSTIFVVLVLLRRQFFSKARQVLIEQSPETGSLPSDRAPGKQENAG